MSQLTRDLLADAGYQTLDLGRHRLKDIPEQECLDQLVAEGLAQSFPPPADAQRCDAAGAASSTRRTSGRPGGDRVVARPLRRAARNDHRPGRGGQEPVGPGGSGSGLSRAIGSPGRACPGLGSSPVPGRDRAHGGRTRAGGPTARRGASRTRSAARPRCSSWTTSSTSRRLHETSQVCSSLVLDLDILTTSRTPLKLSGEHVLRLYAVAPWTMRRHCSSSSPRHAASFSRRRRFPSVREICRRLDGLPSRSSSSRRASRPPPAGCLQASRRARAARWRGRWTSPSASERSAPRFDWSYALLSDRQTRAARDAGRLRRWLFALVDARAIVEEEDRFPHGTSRRWSAWSLLRSDVTEGDVRVSMLETLREHALAPWAHRLGPAGRGCGSRHGERFLDLAQTAEDEPKGPGRGALARAPRARARQRADSPRVGAERPAASRRRSAPSPALGRFWRAHGHIAEALPLALSRARAGGRTTSPPEVLANALWWSARQAAAQDDIEAEVPGSSRPRFAIFREARPSARDGERPGVSSGGSHSSAVTSTSSAEVALLGGAGRRPRDGRRSGRLPLSSTTSRMCTPRAVTTSVPWRRTRRRSR